MSEIDAVQAIRPALDAFRRGTKRSRLRTFAAVCANGHTLLEVIPTPAGPVALWSQRERWSTDEAGEIVEHRPAREAWRAAFLDGNKRSASVFCRCTEATAVDFWWLGEKIRRGDRRGVVPYS